MPLWSTLEKPSTVLDLEFPLPGKERLIEDFGAIGSSINWRRHAEATIQMVFGGTYNIRLPDNESLPPSVLNSQPYSALRQYFYELVKNSIDAKASRLELSIFIGDDGKELEIVVADVQPGKGFRAGKLAGYFSGGDKLVSFHSIVPKGTIKLESEKERRGSLGGAGRGWINLSKKLERGGARLELQSTELYPAILRLKGLVGVNEKTLMVENEDEKAASSTKVVLKAFSLAMKRAGKKEDQLPRCLSPVLGSPDELPAELNLLTATATQLCLTEPKAGAFFAGKEPEKQVKTNPFHSKDDVSMLSPKPSPFAGIGRVL